MTPPAGVLIARSGRREELSLGAAAECLLNEGRMLLPGSLALLGFQLLVVFSASFGTLLNPGEQIAHFVATGLVAIAIALIMTPAAYHRITGARQVSEAFIADATQLLWLSTVPLASSICVDLYLVGRVIIGTTAAAAVTAGIAALFVIFWVALPRAWRVAQHRASHSVPRPLRVSQEHRIPREPRLSEDSPIPDEIAAASTASPFYESPTEMTPRRRLRAREGRISYPAER